jgi:DNA processing protein
MHNKQLILHLTLIENIGPATIQPIIERSDVSASDFYLFSASDWMHTFGFTSATAQKLAEGLSYKKNLEDELNLIERNNIQWATIQDEAYPQLLREIYLPPSVLYWQGKTDFSDMKKSLSVVGARKADTYGYRVVNTLIPDLVAANYTIVSGGAKGIDTMAHEATIKSGGKTIAVLGSGLLHLYPAGNMRFFKSIVDHGGLVVSSFPLRMEPLPGHFPARNRIITGLSRGCLVVQAAKKSGALISAHYAMEQGREVFAVPGLFDDELSVGCNTLIQSGAKLVTSVSDILEEFGDRVIIDNRVIQEKAIQLSFESAIIPEKKIEKPHIDKYALSAEASAKEEKFSDTQKKIIVACKQSTSFDSIINVTQLTAEIIQSELFNLQLDGVVSQDFTGMWVAL